MRRMLQSRKQGWTMVDYSSVVFRGKETKKEKKGSDWNRGCVCECAFGVDADTLQQRRSSCDQKGGTNKGVLKKKKAKSRKWTLPTVSAPWIITANRSLWCTRICRQMSSWSQDDSQSTRLDLFSMLSADLRYSFHSDGRHNVDAKLVECLCVNVVWMKRKMKNKDILLLLFSFFPSCQTIPLDIGIDLKKNVAVIASVHNSCTRVSARKMVFFWTF